MTSDFNPLNVIRQVFLNVIIPVSFTDNFANLAQDVVLFLTPSSDYNSLLAKQGSELIWGRHGNDSLIGFDPAAARPGQRQIDIFMGDVVDEEFYEFLDLVGEGIERTPREWQDRFILGDWQQPYYVGSQPLNFLGLNQFAIIADFNPDLDTIQLHGTPQDYQLRKTPLGTGTALFWRQGTSIPDLIAFLPGVSDLSINDRFFQFEGDTPPPDPVLAEALQLGTTGLDFIFSATVDLAGNIYVGGGTTGSLGGVNLGSRDAWLSKFDRNGNQLWTEQFGTVLVETAWAMANDGNHIYVVGDTSGDLANTNQGGRDVYLTKFDRDGNQLWKRQFGSSTFDQSFAITTDSIGNIYISGQSIGDLGGPNNNKGQNLGSTEANQSSVIRTTDSFVTKFDSDGNQLWIKKFGTAELDDVYNVAIDEDNNIFAGGLTTGDLGGENAGLYDAWVVKFDNNGQLQWIEQFGTPDYEFLWSIDTDSEGNVYATGWTLGDLAQINAGSFDTWVTKYNSNGERQWIQQFGTSGDDGSGFFSGDIEVDSNDNVFLTGSTDGNLGGPNAGSYDAWVAKYDSDGNRQWIQQFGTPDYDIGSTVTADSAGNLYVTGFTEGSLGAVNAGAVDGWIVKLDAESGILQDFSGKADSWREEDFFTKGMSAKLNSTNQFSVPNPLPTNDALTIGQTEPLTSLDFSAENLTSV